MSDRTLPIGNPAAAYSYLVPLLTSAARRCGYALALHGSMKFDLDLLAVPWHDQAESPEALIAGLCSALAANDDRKPVGPEEKPHGRLAWIIPLGAGLALDVSVMPRGPRVTEEKIAMQAKVAQDMARRGKEKGRGTTRYRRSPKP